VSIKNYVQDLNDLIDYISRQTFNGMNISTESIENQLLENIIT